MAYIKSHSEYVVKKKHQDIAEGTVYERDLTTVGGLVETFDGSNVVYRSGNFILTNSKSEGFGVSRRKDSFKPNDYGGEIWNLGTLSSMGDIAKQQDVRDTKWKRDVYDMRSFAYYGSAHELVRCSFDEIARTYPGEIYVPSDSTPRGVYSYTKADGSAFEQDLPDAIYSRKAYNPYLIDMLSSGTPDEAALGSFCNGGYLLYDVVVGDDVYPVNAWEAENRYWYGNGTGSPAVLYSDGGRYTWGEIVTMGLSKDCFLPGDECGIVSVGYSMNGLSRSVEFKCFMGMDNSVEYYASTRTPEMHIRPKERFLISFFNGLCAFSNALLDEPVENGYRSVFEFLDDTEIGIVKRKRSFVFPFSEGGYNLDCFGWRFSDYSSALLSVAEKYDEVYTDNICRKMVHEPISNFDWSRAKFIYGSDSEELKKDGLRITRLLRVYGRFFDERKYEIESIADSNTVRFSDRGTASDDYVSMLLESDGWRITNVSTKSLKEYVDFDGERRYRKVSESDPNAFDDTFEGALQPEGEFSEADNSWYGDDGKGRVLNREFSDDSDYTYVPYSKTYLTHPEGCFVDRCCNVIENVSGTTHLDSEYEYIDAYGQRMNICDGKVRINGTDFRAVDGKVSVTLDGVHYETFPVKTGSVSLSLIKGYSSAKEYGSGDINAEFRKRLKLCSRHILRKKGTEEGVESLMSLLGFRSKRWYDALPEESRENQSYEYSLKEYTCLTKPFRDNYLPQNRKTVLERLNGYKNVRYDLSDPYDGLMAKGYNVYADRRTITMDRFNADGDENRIAYRLVFPNYVMGKKYDGGAYYQMYGGWKKSEPYRFDSMNRVITPPVYNGCVYDTYSRTWRHVKNVDDMRSLIDMEYVSASDGMVCYVEDVSTPYMVVGGRLFEIKSESVKSGDTLVECSYINLYSNGFGLSIGDYDFAGSVVVSSVSGRCDDECGDTESPEYMKMMRRRYDFNGVPKTVKCYLYTIEDISGQGESGGGGQPDRSGEIVSAYVKKPFHYVPGMDLDGINPTVDVFNSDTCCAGSWLYQYDERYGSKYFVLYSREWCNALGELGWQMVPEGAFIEMEKENEDTLTEGNNPHSDSEGYDCGKGYIDRMARLFGYSLEHTENLQNQEYSPDELAERVSWYGFVNLSGNGCPSDYVRNEDTKVHCFADLYTCNGWRSGNTGNVMSYDRFRIPLPEQAEYDSHSGCNVMDSANTAMYGYGYLMDNVDRVHHQYGSGLQDPYVVPSSAITAESETGYVTGGTMPDRTATGSGHNAYQEPTGSVPFSAYCTDRIVNTKVLEATFYLDASHFGNDEYGKGFLEQVKFLEDCVIPYMEQVIPSTSIFCIRYKIRNPETNFKN